MRDCTGIAHTFHATHVSTRVIVCMRERCRARVCISWDMLCVSLSIETHTQKLSQKTFPELSDACVFWVVRIVSCHACIYFSYMHDMTRTFVHLREWWKCGYFMTKFFVAYLYTHDNLCLKWYYFSSSVGMRDCTCIAHTFHAMHVSTRVIVCMRERCRARVCISWDMLCVSLCIETHTQKLSQKTFPELSDACVFWVVRVVSCHACITFLTCMIWLVRLCIYVSDENVVIYL